MTPSEFWDNVADEGEVWWSVILILAKFVLSPLWIPVALVVYAWRQIRP